MKLRFFSPGVEILEARDVPADFTTSWVGSISNNFFDRDNWNNGVPDQNAHVVLR
jgi:hypothetical protein